MTGTPLASQLIQTRLRSVKRQIRSRFLIHGLGWLLGAGIGLLLLHQAMDRFLLLPSPVRILLLAGLLYFFLLHIKRKLLYPQKRAIGLDDVALLVERNNPEFQQELVSALEYAEVGRVHPGESVEMAELLIRQAEEDLSTIELKPVLRSEQTLRVWGLATAAILGLLGTALLWPESFGIWTARLVGLSYDYPRKTFLKIEIPDGQGNYRLQVPKDKDAPIQVRLARASELPVVVKVKGTMPPFVELAVAAHGPQKNSGAGSTEQRVVMGRRGTQRFRHRFRRTLQSFKFQAIGGDDPGTRWVHVEILSPPTALDLRVAIEPPAYTGLPLIKRSGGLVEALPGSRVLLSLHSSVPIERGQIRFQESGATLDLLPVLASAVKDDGGEVDLPPKRYLAEFMMENRQDRYRIELFAKNGLSEVSKAVYSVVPVIDRKPKVRLFTPGASLQALTIGASFPLRLVATDDFGLQGLRLTAKIGEKGEGQEIVLFQANEGANEGGSETGAAVPGGGGKQLSRRRVAILRFFSPSSLLSDAERKPREGDRLKIEILARDIRQPDPQLSQVQTFRFDLVDPEELRRRLQARLRTTRRTVEIATKVQGEQRIRLEAFVEEIQHDGKSSASKLSFSSLESGQRRVQSSLRRIVGNFAESLDAHIFNGLDENPAIGDVIEAYTAWFEAHPAAPSTDPAFYVELNKARRAGRIGRMDVVGRLADMFGISNEIYEKAVTLSLRSLAEASNTDDDKILLRKLEVVQKAQLHILAGLARLLALLQEWNEYQDLIRAARQLNDKQNSIMLRNERK